MSITIVLLGLLVYTFVQALQNPAASPAAPSAVPTISPAPTPATAPSPSAAASGVASAPASASAAASAPASGSAGTAASASAAPKSFASPPPMTIDTSRHYTATIETEKGTIVLDLDPSLAPMTVNNFVFLANQHFYDGLRWHRVVPGFVIQGGDPQGTGAGGPGYKFPDELPKSSSVYADGCVAMANSGPNTNGSQFFICIADDTKSLQPLYSYFGRVTSGLDVAKQITTSDHMQKVTIT